MGGLKVINVKVSEEQYRIAKVRSAQLGLFMRAYIGLLIDIDGVEGKKTAKRVKK
jgi:hypothetical protein